MYPINKIYSPWSGKMTIFQLLNSQKLISSKIWLFEWQKNAVIFTLWNENFLELTYPVSPVSVWHFWMKMQRKVKILVLSVSIENVCLQIFLTDSSRWKIISNLHTNQKFQKCFKIDSNPFESNDFIFFKMKIIFETPDIFEIEKMGH